MLINVEQLANSERRARAARLPEKAAATVFDFSDEAEVAFRYHHDAEDATSGEKSKGKSAAVEGEEEKPDTAPRAAKEKVFTAPIDDRGVLSAFSKSAKNLSVTFSPTVASEREQERMLNGDDLVAEFFLRYALIAAQAICRITVRDSLGRELGCATGFMVAPRLLLTNWHVFQTAELAANSVAEFNYTLDLRGEPVEAYRFKFQPEQFFVSDKELDYALVAVGDVSIDGKTKIERFGYHRLIPGTGKIEEGEWITIIQHPGGKRRQFSIRDNELVKKNPGDKFMWYRSDTAQGSSGSPAFNDSFQVVALHHLGRAKRDENGKYILRDDSRVDSIKGLDDSQVVWEANEGLRVSVLCASLAERLKNSENEFAKQFFAAIDGTDGDIMSNALNGKETATVDAPEIERKAINKVREAISETRGGQESVVTITVPTNLENPMHLSLGFGADSSGIAATPAAAADKAKLNGKEKLAEGGDRFEQPDEAFEFKMVEPFIDNDYSTREGYDENFLGVDVPLPTVTDEDLVSKMDDGEYVIPYEHFSVVVNKKRRLALFTASNVDGGKKARMPETMPQGSYGRYGLSGLVKDKEQEKWRTDPRVPELHQLPDKFYNKDRQSFDKGHIVRRDDVCWGASYKQIKKANGDTYHTTNCSPQIKKFNQSQQGGIWGKLENYVLDQAEGKTGNAPEKYTIFSGPVFADDDEWFEGYDDRGRIRVQIPRKFWKIVIARAGGDLQAFAFLLEQNLQSVLFEEEFQVNEDWDEHLVGIEQLQAMLDGIEFPQEIIDADQADTDGGNELMRLAEIQRLK